MRRIATFPACATSVVCQVAAHGTLRAPPELIASLRRSPMVAGREPLPASFLRHAEDQTVVALTAVMRAITRAGWEGRSFADWGIVSAPNYLGRATIARTLQRYTLEGAWGVAPQLIPHQALHAVSGTISQALKIYGPHFGVSGGADAVLDAFMVAASFLESENVPGLWLTLTGHDEEYVPAPEQVETEVPTCSGVALALTRPDAGSTGLQLRIAPEPAEDAELPDFQLAELIEQLAQPFAGRVWRLGSLGWVTLEDVPGRDG